MAQPTNFKERADAIKKMADDVASAPILSRMAMATDLVASAADLVGDMAGWVDSQTAYIDEEDTPAAAG
jgi:hypothetical protein|tara:strand:- start:4639 stop:4845 length:207 start_codon:yes stop_codon:yes gene_type:complete